MESKGHVVLNRSQADSYLRPQEIAVNILQHSVSKRYEEEYRRRKAVSRNQLLTSECARSVPLLPVLNTSQYTDSFNYFTQASKGICKVNG
jgi:hypothetical protein